MYKHCYSNKGAIYAKGLYPTRARGIIVKYTSVRTILGAA